MEKVHSNIAMCFFIVPNRAYKNLGNAYSDVNIRRGYIVEIKFAVAYEQFCMVE